MRFLVAAVLLGLAASCWPSVALAQAEKKFQPPEIKKINVGFQSFQDQDRENSTFKVGLWAPVYVEVFGGTDGIEPKANQPPPRLEIETVDSEDVGTRIGVPVAVEPLATRNFIGYVKTGHMSMNNEGVKVTLHVNGREFSPTSRDLFSTLGVNAHLYLVLGKRMAHLHAAIRRLGMPEGKEKEDFNLRGEGNGRAVVFENEVERLPEHWFGYNGVDLLILTTENRAFLTKLGNKDNRDRLKALAQWVRRGGRLVVPIAHQNQDVVSALLKNEYAWQPAIPVVPPAVAGNVQQNALSRLTQVEEFGKVQGEPYQRVDPANPQRIIPIPVALLDDGKTAAGDWEILADSGDKTGNRPLIARVRYGLGQITYLAVSLEDATFLAWPAKDQFLQTLALRLAPRAPALIDQDFGFRGRDMPNDLTTDLLGQLDKFDVTVIEFGYVALFIILYILVVGPLDFVLLKYVFKRLEWTWITFPTVVLGVSVVAYFAAYALKGRDLKINKIDIVDFDMRTSLDEKRKPQNVHAYGQTFFTILSPRIQNYTIGVEPNPEFWGAKAEKPLRADLVSWMGRPSDGPHAMGRGGSGGFFRKPYTFRDDASGLEGVPIPVWTTKAFSASWEQTLEKPPFVADLVYHQKEIRGQQLRISGQLENHLAVDLADVWLIYDKQFFPIENGLKSARSGAAPREISIVASSGKEIRSWVSAQEPRDEATVERVWTIDPSGKVKEILFHERFDTQNVGRNHLLRPLDFGWRVEEEPRGQRDLRTREAILFARVRYAHGPAETLMTDASKPPATKLWLGDIPGLGRPRPALSGQMNQDTYVRVLLAVRPADE